MNRKRINSIAIILLCVFITTFIVIKNKGVMASVSDKPNFDVNITSVSKNQAVVNESITVSGTIVPKPFEITVQEKENLLLQDTSNIMDKNININEEETTEIDELKDEINNLEDKIIDSYQVNNVKLTVGFNEGFSLIFGDKEIDIGDIVYNEISEDGGQVKYEACQIPFSFTVKGSEIGDDQSIYNKLEISYKWNDKIITKDTNTVANVSIESNELPNIKANILTEKNVTINENEEVTLKYEIQPESFSFNDEINIVKSDVVFVIDVSKDMSGYMNPLINDIWNDILNNDKLKLAKTEYDVITFSNKLIQVVDLSSSNYVRYEDYISDLNNNYIKKILTADNSNSKNITVTYNDNKQGNSIVKLLENGREGAVKNVIFISETSNISYGSDKDYGDLKEKGYNIITVEIENLNNSNNKNDLKDFHKILNGVDENYFYSKDQNELQNNILPKVANSIISNSDYKDYDFFPKLQIDLDGNFDLVSGAEKVENNIGVISVPKITYKYSKSDNIYNAEKVNVEFTIRPKIGKIGSLNFGSENKLIYKKLVKNEDKYSLVETPTIIVKPQIKNLIHGLYNGIINDKVTIQQNNNDKGFEVVQNSTVTFGAKFTLSSNSIDFNLNIDSKFNQVNSNDIKVYKVIKSSSGTDTLIEIVSGSKTITNTDTNNFNISIKDFKDNSLGEDTDILVIYKARVKNDVSENESLINTIKFSNIDPRDVKITTPVSSNESPTLPDLF